MFGFKRLGSWKFSLLVLAFFLIGTMIVGHGQNKLIVEAQENPTELNMAAIFISPLEEPWGLSFMHSLDRVIEEAPYDLDITLGSYTEDVWGAEAEHILREYAASGQYDIIWATSSYSDQVENLYQEFPEILWVYFGSGNEPLGENAYWIYMYVYEAAYLLGMVAGEMTETNIIGVVAGYPFDDVNDSANAFIAGAKAVNPDVKARVSYIESWYDPPKARETAFAQISAGADYIYAERLGVYEAAREEGVYAFGHYTDQHQMAPEVVVSSTIARWDPGIKYIIDEWWQYKTEGVPLDAPMEPVWFQMGEGGSDIAPFHAFEDKLPQEVLDMVEEAKQKIIDGELVVPFNVEPAQSDF